MAREAVIVEAGKSDRLDDPRALPDGAARGGVSGAAARGGGVGGKREER